MAVRMSALSAVTVALGFVRELALARELQASAQADAFFAAIAVIGSARVLALGLFRTRWIPDDSACTARALLRRDRSLWIGIAVAACVALPAVAPRGGADLAAMVAFAVAAVVGTAASTLRAAAEREGRELRGYVAEWAPIVGVTLGVTLAPVRDLWAPALGLALGSIVGAAPLFGVLARRGGPPAERRIPASATAMVMGDIVAYGALGLLDAFFVHRFAVGDYARLGYAYMLINAVMAVPTGALTVVGLQLARGRGGTPWRWVLLAGATTGCAVVAMVLALGLDPVRRIVDGVAGWPLVAAIEPLLPWMIPFAILRMANVVGRQAALVALPAPILMADLLGLALRAFVLLAVLTTMGPIASPIGLAAGEIVQLMGWSWVARARRRSDPAAAPPSSH